MWSIRFSFALPFHFWQKKISSPYSLFIWHWSQCLFCFVLHKEGNKTHLGFVNFIFSGGCVCDLSPPKMVLQILTLFNRADLSFYVLVVILTSQPCFLPCVHVRHHRTRPLWDVTPTSLRAQLHKVERRLVGGTKALVRPAWECTMPDPAARHSLVDARGGQQKFPLKWAFFWANGAGWMYL